MILEEFVIAAGDGAVKVHCALCNRWESHDLTEAVSDRNRSLVLLGRAIDVASEHRKTCEARR